MNKKTDHKMDRETLNKDDYRDEKGRFIKGAAPGRPIGSKNYTTLLEEAIKNYETNKGKKLFDRLIERAFISDMVLLNVVKKFIPDKTHTEIEAEFVDKTVDEDEQELERKFVEKLEQDPEYKKRVIKHYEEAKKLEDKLG